MGLPGSFSGLRTGKRIRTFWDFPSSVNADTVEQTVGSDDAHTHKAEEKLYVDFAGLTMSYTNPSNGEEKKAYGVVLVISSASN